MNKFRFTINALAVVVFALAFVSIAQAQATRTWVSGVGDDANPCSRTAPCKTFAGAISKTATDGEISVLDPGGFGTLTITKSITINGTHGAGFGSVLAAGGVNGFNINITAAGDVRKTVRLVSLNINGASSGLNGISITAANRVSVEDTIIDGFTNRGINDVRTGSGSLFVTDCTVRNTVQSAIVAIPGGGATITAVLDNVRVEASTSNSGVAFDSSVNAGSAVKGTIRNSILVGNSASGAFAAGTGTEMTIENCLLSHNGTGITAIAPVIVRLSNSTITNNTTSITGQNQVSSTGTNTITGNGANNQPAGPPIGQT
ncbi:MAG TPA: hypothetical protein DCK93_01855 [Blastocatellia bacterium]|nr:hypothetical protein [Blastocatellia bacterium]HAF21647.1 hypothetical protein [Blastocatellia bacterium]